jgi:IclR family transcriptional regulator, acetate operon repressor
MPGLLDARHSAYQLRAVDRVCDVLDVLAGNPPGMTLSAISATAELPKSSTFRYLAALEIRGYVQRTDDGFGYRLAPAAQGRQGLRSKRLESLLAVAKPLMTRLAGGDSGVWMLATFEGSGIRFLWVTAPRTADERVPPVGGRAQLHDNALGKAVAAQLSDDAVLGQLSTAGMPAGTSKTLTSPTSFLRELHRVRVEGFAGSDQERYTDTRAVAVPIGGETMALGMADRSDALPPDRVVSVVRQLRRASVVLARDLRGER